MLVQHSKHSLIKHMNYYIRITEISRRVFTSRPFLKSAGGIVLGSVARLGRLRYDVLPYISIAIKASFLKLGMCIICKNNGDSTCV